MKTRIALVDDHLMFTEGLASLIQSQSDMEFVGNAINGKQAILFVEKTNPDLIIIDVGMPELNGIEAVKQLKDRFPSMRIIGLSGHLEHHIIREMLRAGASGYVLKSSPFSELTEAIHTVMNDHYFISPSISGELLMESIQARGPMGDSAFSVLSHRELEILQSIAEGKSTKEIASELSISAKTVETHRKQIMDKLDIHSVAELTRYAIREEVTQA